MATFNYKSEYERYKRYYVSLTPLLNKPENKAYTAIIFSFLAVSLFGWYAIRPTMQTIFLLKREIKDKTQVDKQMEDKISALIEAQAAYQEIEPGIPTIAQALPGSTSPIVAIVQIRGLATDTNVTIASLNLPQLPLTESSTSAGLANPKVITYQISLSANGTYDDLKKFLLGMSDLRRIMRIDGLTLTTQKNGKIPNEATGSATISHTGTLLTLDLKLLVYYLSTSL